MSSAMRARVQPALARRLAQAVAQPVERAEIEVAVAPLQRLHGSKVCVSSRSIEVGRERLDAAGDAERAVVHVAAGAAGDLAELAGVSSRCTWPSNLRVPAKAT